ncbi:phage tail protein [Enterococcus faecalis]
MSDGRVEIDVEVDGKGVASLNNRLNQLTDVGGRAGISIKNLVVSMGLLKVASAAITASINAIKTSFSSAISEGAKLEQSIGGVETLFKENADIVKNYANQAFKTAGVSANKYMENVTSFSASLIGSLGGDTKKAAELANTAMIDMSDNANKMGTDMEMITQTYQSLARGNYAMLDNLKLGYGGTKSEMERLMKDAEKLTGEHYTVGDFADTVKAIHAVQESLGITGTTAKEAATTMSGSFASMKAAMQNVLGKLAIGEDIKDELNDLATTTSTFLFGNFIPMVKRILQGLPELFSTFTKLAVDHLKKGLSELTGKDLSKPIDTVVEVASKAIKNVKEAIQSVMAVFSNVSGGPTAWVSTISKAFIALNSVITASANIVKKFMTALGETGAIQNVKNAIESVSNAFKKITDSVGDASIWSTLGTAIGNVISVIARGVQVVAEFISKLDPKIIQAFTNVLVGTVVGFSAVKTGMKGLDFIQSFNPFNAFRKNVETGMTGAEKSISRSKSTIAQIFSGLSNIVKSSGNAIKASATGIGTGIKTALTGVATAAKGIGAGLAATFKGIGQAMRLAGPANILALGASVGVAAISISAGIGIIISALTLLATQGEGVATIINAIGTAFSMVATTIIGAFAQAIITVSSVLPIITSALSGLAPLVVAIGVAIGAMSPAIEAVGTAIGATAPAITALGTAISTVISSLPPVISALGSAISQIVTAITPIIQILADAFLQLVPIVGNAISQIIQAITPIVPEITKMVEAIAPILGKIVEAFQTLIQEIKPIVDSITNLIKELGTQISNILTEAGNVINTFGDNVKKVFDGASNVVKSFGDTVKNILDGIAGIFDSIGNAALNAGKGVKQMAQGIKILVDLKLGDLGATLAATATGLAAITASGIATAGPGLQQAGTGLMMIATAGQTATVALQMLPNILTVFSNSIGNLPIKMNEVASSFASFASRAVMGLAGLSGANIHIATFRAQLMTIPPTLNMASASFNLFVSRAMSIGTTLMTIQTMITSFNAKVMTISATLNNVSNSFGSLTKVSDSVKNALSGVSSGLMRVSSSANVTKNQISNMVAGSSAQIKSMASSTKIVVTSFNAMRAQIQTSMLSIVNILITSGNKMKNQGRIIGQQTAQNIAQGILNAIPMGSSAMISLMQAVLTAGMSNINGMRNIGLMIGYGLAEGMYASLGEVTRAANALVEQADRAARAKAEIHSPSRLFRDNVGRYISQGIAVGIEKDANNAYSAMDKLITGLMPNVTPEIALGTSKIGMASVGSQIVNNTTNQSQSYRPVFHFNIEKADLSSDKSIEETSERLAILTERQIRGRLK